MPDISLPLTSPAWVFFTLLLVALVFPVVAERFRLPGVIGLVLGGLLVGPQVLGLLELRGLVAQLGGFGVLYLMFLAGLELDLDVLQRGKRTAGVFGGLTFLLPISLGTAAGLALGFDMAAAILIGSFWASHTLVAYPTVRRHGLARDPAVTSTLGATIITDTLALMVLAAVVAVEMSSSPPPILALRLIAGIVILGLFAFVVLPRVTIWFFRGMGQDGVLRYLSVVCGLLATAVVADLAGTEPIVGAFFAGLALNRLVPDSGFLMRRIEFVGSSFLIPIFLISVGMLIDLSVVTELRTLVLAVVFTAVTIVSKYLAAWITARFFGFDRFQVGVMFSLSVAQAAATLAAAIVGFEAGVIDEETVNAALLVILVTVLLASWTAARSAPKVTPPPTQANKLGRNVLVPFARLEATPHLVELALMVARADSGSVVPIHILTSSGPEAIRRGRDLQSAADQLVARQGAEVAGLIRVDASVVQGIANAVVENDASLVVIGWTETSHARRAAIGSVVDDVVARVPAPVAVAHLPHMNLQRIVLVELRGASPVETAAAHQLATRIARSAGVTIHGCAAAGAAPTLPLPPVDMEAIGIGDLVVLAAPGGDGFAGTVESFVDERPDRPVVAIRAYADAPSGFTPYSDLFRD